MPSITYVDVDGARRTIEAAPNATVMEVALKNDVPGILGECGGACACATCHVYIDDDWMERVGPAEDMEQGMLDFAFDVRENSRLSCQIFMTPELDGLVVHTPSRQG